MCVRFKRKHKMEKFPYLDLTSKIWVYFCIEDGNSFKCTLDGDFVSPLGKKISLNTYCCSLGPFIFVINDGKQSKKKFWSSILFVSSSERNGLFRSANNNSDCCCCCWCYLKMSVLLMKRNGWSILLNRKLSFSIGANSMK